MALPHPAYGPSVMSPNDRTEIKEAMVVFCATCGHSEFVHADSGNERCLFSVCDCNGFVAGATPDSSAQDFPGEKNPSPLEVETDRDGSILLGGQLDMATAKQLEEAVAEIMKPGRPVVIDMAQLNFIDSSGVRVLIRTYRQTGERVVICNPPFHVLRVLEVIDARVKPEAWVIQADRMSS